MRAAWLALVLLPASALGCELVSHLKVIGFNASESLVAVREETDATIAVRLYELPAGKLKVSFDIITFAESQAVDGDLSKLGRLRDGRWRKARIALEKSGVAVDGKYPMSKELTLGNVKFITRNIPPPEEWMAFAAEAVRVEGKTEKVIDSVDTPTVSDPVGYDGFVLSPSKKQLIILRVGCQAEPAFVAL